MTEFFTQTMATLDAEYLTLLRAEQKPSLEQLRAFHRTCETLFAHLDKDLKPMQMHFNDDLQQKRLHFIYFTYLELALDEERMKDPAFQLCLLEILADQMAHKYAYRSEHFAKFFKEDQANRGLALIFVYFKLWSTSQVKNEAYEHDIVDTLDRLLSGFPHGVGQTQRRVFLACHQLRLDFMQKGDKEKFRAARRHFYEVMELEQQVDDNKNCWDGIVKFMKPIKRFYTENGFTDEFKSYLTLEMLAEEAMNIFATKPPTLVDLWPIYGFKEQRTHFNFDYDDAPKDCVAVDGFKRFLKLQSEIKVQLGQPVPPVRTPLIFPNFFQTSDDDWEIPEESEASTSSENAAEGLNVLVDLSAVELQSFFERVSIISYTTLSNFNEEFYMTLESAGEEVSPLTSSENYQSAGTGQSSGTYATAVDTEEIVFDDVTLEMIQALYGDEKMLESYRTEVANNISEESARKRPADEDLGNDDKRQRFE